MSASILGPVRTPLHSCAEPKWWIKYGKRAASESIWYGSFSLVRQKPQAAESVALFDTGAAGDSVAAARKRGHQWCLTLTPHNTKTIERMTCHRFQRPIRRDLMSSCYTILIIWRAFRTFLGLVSKSGHSSTIKFCSEYVNRSTNNFSV